jgi:uncharacterized membrane protein
MTALLNTRAILGLVLIPITGLLEYRHKTSLQLAGFSSQGMLGMDVPMTLAMQTLLLNIYFTGSIPAEVAKNNLICYAFHEKYF